MSRLASWAIRIDNELSVGLYGEDTSQQCIIIHVLPQVNELKRVVVAVRSPDLTTRS